MALELQGAELQSADEVIIALGGMIAVSKLVGVTPRAVWNWPRRRRLPAETYLVIKAALAEKGFTAPPALFGMRKPHHPCPCVSSVA